MFARLIVAMLVASASLVACDKQPQSGRSKFDLPAAPTIQGLSLNGRMPSEVAKLLDDPHLGLRTWIQLFDAAEIPVIDENGNTVAGPKADRIGPNFWTIWYLQKLDRHGRGISLADAAILLLGRRDGVPKQTVADLLLQDLRAGVTSTEPTTKFIFAVIRERILRSSSRDIADPTNDARSLVIDPSTLQLVAWATIRQVVSHLQVEKKTARALDYIDLVPISSAIAADKVTPCSEVLGTADATYWTKWVLDKVASGVQLPGVELRGLVKYIADDLNGALHRVTPAEAGRMHHGRIVKGIEWADRVGTLLSLVAKITSLSASTYQEPDPLVRTKTIKNGDVSKILIAISLNGLEDGAAGVACFYNFVFNSLGISAEAPTAGRLVGVQVKVEGRQGFPDLVLFGDYRAIKQDTNANGEVIIPIIGKGQKFELSPNSKSIDKEFSISVSSQADETNINSVANVFWAGLTAGTKPSSVDLDGIADIIESFQYNLGEFVFRVTDWMPRGWKALEPFYGDICDLAQPFTIHLRSEGDAPFQFTPIDVGIGGVNISWVWSGGGVTASGSGSYTVKFDEDGSGVITLLLPYTVRTPMGSFKHSDHKPIRLVPLTNTSCN